MNTAIREEVERGGGLVGAVRHFARASGAAPALTFIDYRADPAGVDHVHTYREVDRRARAVAAGLRDLSSDGARVAVVCAHDIQYVTAFLGCLYAGRVAVPMPEPDQFRNGSRVSAILADCTAELVVADRDLAGDGSELLDPRGWPQRRVVHIDDLEAYPADDGEPAEPDPADLAYLQYTSGSTRTPSGVRITHGNLAANIDQILAVTDYLVRGAVVAGWVPYYHDMGLVLGLALPLSIGAHSVQLRPTAFIQSPYRWLKAVSDHRAIWTGGPNFAYDMCVSRISAQQRRTLDLSCIRGLLNGSEAIRPKTLEHFTTAFSECGLAADVGSPAYGLAEATLGVTGPMPGDMPQLVYTFDREQLAEGRVAECGQGFDNGRTMVGCGMPLAGIDLRIVDPDSSVTTEPNEVGEIWLRGPNIADGYWNQPDLSARVFGARCRDRDGTPIEGTWLRTGDLGFLHRGMLFIAGRDKDLIIIDGKNHDPADVEATILEASTSHRVSGVAVFSVDDGGDERVVAAVETRRALSATVEMRQQITTSIRSTVSRHHGIDVSDVIVVPSGTIPRTSSHKVQRSRCRERYLRGELGGRSSPGRTVRRSDAAGPI